ncbi:S8 family serine peptidase [Halosolutus amylolyticus]|uniref:S8 family serine peptidase n=1 Tax=Halosolutus amylolyticus TaxID=2932267 RepID=A0ABD5PPC3_9EURY|nr:S8 family serine peptidase [Halosolutus amylolyticus]
MPHDGSSDRDTTPTVYRRTLLTSLSIGGLLGSTGLASATPGRDPGPRKDELVIGFSESVSDVRSAVRSALPSDAEIVRRNERIRYAVVSVPADAPDRARERFVEAVSRVDEVEYVEENATIETIAEPDDPHYDIQHAPQQIDCETAWETTLGDEDVVIAVVDQGIQYDHPAVAETIDDRRGEDVVGSGSDPYPVSDEERHGTHVGAIAAGETDDATGHAGISNCSLLSVRALDESGRGSLSDIADAIAWAADAGADVVNLSLGTGGDYSTLANACEYARDQGCLLVGAAGNGGTDGVAYPAAYESVIGVSAVDADDEITGFSNTGPGIDLAAPGTMLVSAVPWNEYARMSGTSMAAPVVSGVAGLARSAHPDLSGEALREHLQETAVDVGLDADAQGHGRVDAGAAVTTDPYSEGGDESDDEESGGECGDETVTASAAGELSGGWWGESDRYTYSPHTADPCSVTLTLEGPADADFHLYVTLDGRSPTRWDYDDGSADAGASETVTVPLEGDEELGIQVHAESGSGAYTLTVREAGR